MKKIISIGMLILITVVLVACSGSNKNVDKKNINYEVPQMGFNPDQVLCSIKVLDIIKSENGNQIKIEILKVLKKGNSAPLVSTGKKIVLNISGQKLKEKKIKKGNEYKLVLSLDEVPMQNKKVWNLINIK